MKLKNKKTGEINLGDLHLDDFNSLAELNEEWEDYEPEGWCITMYGGISRISEEDKALIPELKEIGNYFGDKESAYDALDKLKAYKRLRDKGFVFRGINESDGTIKTGLSKGVSLNDAEEFYCDMNLLFGGEE